MSQQCELQKSESESAKSHNESASSANPRYTTYPRLMWTDQFYIRGGKYTTTEKGFLGHHVDEKTNYEKRQE